MWLNENLGSSVYVFSGHAGTGKTTFINYLKYKYNNLNWIILDISKASSQIRWLSDESTQINNDLFKIAHTKIFSSILLQIREMLFLCKKEHSTPNMNTIMNNIKKMTTVYKKVYSNAYPPGSRFMDGLISIVKKNFFFTNKRNTVLQLEKYCKQYFDVNDKSILDASITIHALDVLLLLLRCHTQDSNQRFIIVLDSVEKFLLKDEIYNRDIINIRNFLLEYSDGMTNTIHNGKFKFIFSVRNTTLAMYENAVQGGDALENTVDFSDWYDVNEIISKKKIWYSKNGFDADEAVELVEQIVGDIRICNNKKFTGLKLFIDPLFNNNTRLIMDFIGMIIEKEDNQNIIKKYKEFWQEDTSIARFAARSLIRGLILEQLKNSDKLFMHLKTYTERDDDSGLGISRKILTILHNNTHERRLFLKDILQEIIAGADIEDIAQNEQYNRDRAIIAEVLFYMNSCNRKDNDWIQFIDLQIENSAKSINAEDYTELEDLLCKRFTDFSLSIMPAGETYLKEIVASFEFFSIRYNKAEKYIPLFGLIPSEDDMKNCINFEDLPCINTIKLVAAKVINCIEEMEKVYQIDYILENKNRITHSKRIKSKHKDYINLFINYLSNKYIRNDKLDKKVKQKYQKLITVIDKIKMEYPYLSI